MELKYSFILMTYTKQAFQKDCLKIKSLWNLDLNMIAYYMKENTTKVRKLLIYSF